jgi:formylglycine-generating enzyme required for sulfatase activity
LYNTNMAPVPPTNVYACRIIRSGSVGSYTYTIGDGGPEDLENWGSRPVTSISWDDALRFANWMHNGQPVGPQDLTTTEDGSYYLNGATAGGALESIVRQPGATWVVPTEDEWYKAAYHKNDGISANYWTYPTQSTGTMFGGGIPDNIVVDPDPGNSACYHLGDPDHDPLDWPYYKTPVGEFENSYSAYCTFDQGGNVWEWTETRKGDATQADRRRRITRGGSFYPSVIGEQPDGFKCMHGAWRGDDDVAVAQLGRRGFRVAKVTNDCDENGILDQTDLANGTAHDYNYNGILDSCDIAHGTSLDCNLNGIPDEAEIGGVNPTPYLVDDGVPAEDVAAFGYPGNEDDGYLAWINQFSIVAGRETISAIIPACLDFMVPTGTPFTVYLWSDPNGDGNPADALVLASAPVTMSPTLTAVDIPDTYVGPAGTKFFVGGIMHITDTMNMMPASYDDTSDHRVSWIAYGAAEIDPNTLSGAETLANLRTWQGAMWGNFMVRALPAGPIQLPDDNHNGIPDVCEATTCQTLPGDVDGDNDVDGNDIQNFITCFLQGPGVTPACRCADVNLPQPDGVLDGQDITRFVSLLLGS